MIAVGHKAPFYMEIGVRLRIYKIEQFSSALELDLRPFPQIARIIQNIIMACFNNKNNNVSPCSAGKKADNFLLQENQIMYLIYVPDSDNLVFLWTMSYSLWTM